MKKGFQIHVTLVGGEVLSSDAGSWADIVNETHKQNTARLLSENEIEKALEQLMATFEKVGTMENMQIIVKGESYGINPKHILYVRIVRI